MVVLAFENIRIGLSRISRFYVGLVILNLKVRGMFVQGMVFLGLVQLQLPFLLRSLRFNMCKKCKDYERDKFCFLWFFSKHLCSTLQVASTLELVATKDRAQSP